MKVNKNNIVTIEQYVHDKRVSRVVIRSQQNNYLIDLPINSFLSRCFIVTVISIIKATAFMFDGINIAVQKY